MQNYFKRNISDVTKIGAVILIAGGLSYAFSKGLDDILQNKPIKHKKVSTVEKSKDSLSGKKDEESLLQRCQQARFE